MAGGAFTALAHGFSQHPKILDLHDRAFRFHMVALDWTSSNGTNGHIPAKGVKIVAAIVNTQPTRWARELVTAKLWKHDPDGDGFWINDYLIYNPSAEAMRELSDKRRAAGIRGAEKRWRGQTPEPEATAMANANGKSHSKPQIPAEQKQELGLDKSSGRQFETDDLPETINPENQMLVLRLMHLIGDHADAGTRHIVMGLANKLPPASLNKVLESATSNRPVDRAAYVVGALGRELEERNAA